MIEPYYQDKYATIYHGDCLEVMPHLEPVDLVLTDPPYGIGIADNGFVCKGGKADSIDYGISSWDSEIPGEQYFILMKVLSNHQIIFGGNYFTQYLQPTNGWIVWDKIGNSGSRPNNSDCELVWTSFNKPMRIYYCLWRGMIKWEKGIKQHPAQKPESLIKRIIVDYTDENIVILDPFMGSGTTLVAAKQLRRKAIGIEIEEKYCEIAVRRLAQEVIEFG